ncbi:steroid delta-isomerase [Rhodanobacter glycinis]|uniref:Steroid delta-isomerase n=1 Tax=Rhodanobacter glycinis TaxID=582702 RepID=A0A5B9E1U4_9GAMM|nr:steroid delta-isomerase [Rhodanobacter glycinis]
MTDVVHAYVRALNGADLDAIMALYAEDATVEDPVGSPPKVGSAAIRAFYAASTAMKLDVALEGEIRVTDRVCAFAFRVSLAHEGRTTTIRPIDVFEFDADGRIQRMRAYFGAPNIHH